MPLSLAVQYLSVAPPDENGFLNLPGQAVSGTGSDLSSVVFILTLVGSRLMLENEGSPWSCPVPGQVFFTFGVKVA